MAKTKLAGAKRSATLKPRTMPEFTKPPATLVETFTRAIADLPNVQLRQMFGYPAAFTRAQMFASLFQDQMIVRLSEEDRRALAEEGARPFEPIPGRPMREYVTVPDAIRDSPSAAREWLLKAQTYASSLPPKKKH
jgi:TfoX/Sxy family transcriptional regulator of competence genes